MGLKSQKNFGSEFSTDLGDTLREVSGLKEGKERMGIGSQ